MTALSGIDAVILDIGGTLVVEAAPGTPVADLAVQCLPGVVDDLRALAGRVRLGAATNTAVMGEADVRALLAPTGLDELLEVVVTSSDVGAAKPDPAVLKVALERLGGIDPARALFIGNDAVDAAAAEAIGMPFAWIHPEGLLAAIDHRAEPRRWARPVPLIGDTSSAAVRSAAPDGWRLDEEQRAGLYAAVFARRDVRRFRPDPVPDGVVRRLLAAAHAAPSVGHSQPWRFVLVTSPATRERAALIADRERLAQAAELDPVAGQHLLDLQLEGLREAPLGVVVCCDRRVPPAGVLGRRTFPDADLWSCACAIENLWLAGRAEGLGVGWVTLFPPAELADLLDLPDDVVPLGWLCVGWPDERAPDPGLERAGWSQRLPLDEVVVHERWGDGEAPATPMSKLRAPAPDAVVGARDDADTLLSPLASLGVLDRAIDRIVALGRLHTNGGTLVLAAGRHPVTDLGVSAFPAGVTDDVLAAARAGAGLRCGRRGRCGPGAGGRRRRHQHREPPRCGHAGPGRRAGAGRPRARDGSSRRRHRSGGPGRDGHRQHHGRGGAGVGAAPRARRGDGGPRRGQRLGHGRAEAERRDRRARASPPGARGGARRSARRTGGGGRARAGLPRGGHARGGRGGRPGGARRPRHLGGRAGRGAPRAGRGRPPRRGTAQPRLGHGLVLDELGLEPLLTLRLHAGEGVGACLAASLLLQGLAIRRGAARTR